MPTRIVLVAGLAALIVAVLLYVASADEQAPRWRAVNSFVDGSNRCGFALSPDRTRELRVCVTQAGEVDCTQGTQPLDPASEDCRAARAALAEEDAVPAE
jgi:hypothetical protein